MTTPYIAPASARPAAAGTSTRGKLSAASPFVRAIMRKERSYTSAGVAAAGRQGTHADTVVTLPQPNGRILQDPSIIHRCPTYVSDACPTQGAGAAVKK
jgi:hypothetical protein